MANRNTKMLISKFFKFRIKELKADKWYNENKVLLYSNELLPEYTLDEPLGVTDNPNSDFEQVATSRLNFDVYKLELNRALYDSMMGIYWSAPSKFTSKQLTFIEKYYVRLEPQYLILKFFKWDSKRLCEMIERIKIKTLRILVGTQEDVNERLL